MSVARAEHQLANLLLIELLMAVEGIDRANEEVSDSDPVPAPEPVAAAA